MCIAGTPYSVFTRAGDPKKLLIFLQGGGACWQGFYNCNIVGEAQSPPAQGPLPRVFDPTSPQNPFADHSVVYMPYCDGSTFGGDNDVIDPGFPFGPTRHHRGLRNLSAGMDVARDMFPDAKQITVMGHSAGGVGAAAFAPFLARFAFGNNTKLTVYNDAGPIAVNLGTPPGQTGIIRWRLDNDSTIREGFYETDSDRTNRFFAQGDGTRMDPQAYRQLIVTEHGALLTY